MKISCILELIIFPIKTIIPVFSLSFLAFSEVMLMLRSFPAVFFELRCEFSHSNDESVEFLALGSHLIGVGVFFRHSTEIIDSISGL